MIQLIIAIILIACIILFSLDFEKPYTHKLHELAHHSLTKLIAGLLIVFLADMNPILAILFLIVIFFWFADVNLLSAIKL